MTAWIEAGQPYELFWRLTLSEVYLILGGVERARHRENEIAYFVAYYSGVFSQTYDKGKFPKYDTHRPRREKKSTGSDWRQIKAAVMAWNSLAGGDQLSKKA